MRRLALFLIALLLLLGVAACEKNEMKDLFGRTNQERISRGLPALEWEGYHIGYALDHTNRMIRANRLFHSDLESLRCNDKCKLIGENVGFGPSIADIHRALMNSPAHRANILDPRFDEMAIVVIRGPDERLWVTEIFIGH